MRTGTGPNSAGFQGITRRDRMQADYAQRYRLLWERHWWWRSREALLLDRVERLNRLSPIRTILDAGCGDGLFFDRLARFGRVEGLEPDASLLSDTRWRANIRIGTLGPEFRPDDPYDLVLMLDVLEHIHDHGEALRSAWSILKPGGALLLTVPALPWLWSRHDEANEHHRRYLPRTLRDVLLDAGFVVETLRYAFAWTVVPLLARRWLAPAGRGSGISDYEVSIPPRMINAALTALSRCDHALGRVVRWPIGSSLIAVARRPDRPLSPRNSDFDRATRLPSPNIPGQDGARLGRGSRSGLSPRG